MPGKSQASNRSKQDSSREQLPGSPKSNGETKKVVLWPIWSDSEIEKQEQASGKGRDKAKNSQVPSLYEDTEGVVLPPSLSSMGEVVWKRPTDLPTFTSLNTEDVCLVNEQEGVPPTVDLLTNNTHILHSKFVSWFVSEVGALWKVREALSPGPTEKEEEYWTPWSHIYPHSKSTTTNFSGKYFVKLFWMGSWRKVTIDDYLPFLDRGETSDGDNDGDNADTIDRYQPLYPRTGNPGEIWPALLMKALLKVAVLDSICEEFKDFSVTHLLTGWALQTVTVEDNKRESIWEDVLLPSLPLWVRDSEENGLRKYLVLANFRSTEEQVITKKLSHSSSTESETIQTILKEAGILPSTFDETTSPVFPLLLTQARDEPLVSPPNTPPPPVLQFPCYLGLTNRQHFPSDTTPPSSPPPDNPWFLEVAPRETAVSQFEEEENKEEEKNDEETEECAKSDKSETAADSKSGVWISYSDFLKCFSHLHIFKNPSGYEHNSTYFDLSKTTQEQSLWTQVKKAASSAQLPSKIMTNSSNSNLLFVDSPQPVSIHFVLSCLSNWREGGKNTHTVPLKSPFLQQAGREAILAGCLIVGTFQWNSVQVSKPLLTLRTTGTKGAILSLPPGRHVLKLHVQSPIAYHLTILSNTELQLTDDDNIYSLLSKESSLYTEFCSKFMGSLIEATQYFGRSAKDLKTSVQPLVNQLSSIGLTSNQSMLFLASALDAWSAHGKEYKLTNTMMFAWKCFFYKLFALLEKGLPRSDNVRNVKQLRRSLTKERIKGNESSLNDSSTVPEEQKAATKITRTLQRCIDTRRRKAMTPGSRGNEEAMKQIENSLPSLEPHLNTLATEILNGVFQLEPSLRPLFPFHTDENGRCFSTLYNGSFPQLLPNTWALVLRAVFRVPTSQMLVARFASPVSSYLLRIIDNDTMTELPRVFGHTTPAFYTPNTNGYSVTVEAWCGDGEGVEGGNKWGLRLVSSSQTQPVLEEEELVTPHTQEHIEYCLPDRDNVLFRYVLTPTVDLPVSLYLRLSKPDAYCKLQLLDNDVPVSEVESRKVCILPLVHLQAPAEEGKTHKYVVQAVVIRDSWLTPDTAWPYISSIRSAEKLDDKQDTKPGSAKKGGRGKGAASKKGSVPSSTQLATANAEIRSKPHWILRVAASSADKDNLTVAKDTEKADALRAMVQAWETEQPGRTNKALKSRKKFLEARGVKEDQLASEEEAPLGPIKIQQMDLSQFIINEGPPHLLEESDQELRVAERQRLFKDYRTERQNVLDKRNDDREARNEAKLKQLQQAEEWQSNLDKVRNQVNSGREAIRERHLKNEKAKKEQEQPSQEEAAPTGRDSKAAKAKSGKGKKK